MFGVSNCEAKLNRRYQHPLSKKDTNKFNFKTNTVVKEIQEGTLKEHTMQVVILHRVQVIWACFAIHCQHRLPFMFFWFKSLHNFCDNLMDLRKPRRRVLRPWK